MRYAILRTEKLKSPIALKRSLQHAFRAQDTPNADPDRTPDNTHLGAHDVDDVLAKFNDRLATQQKVRKNAVLAVEYLITASAEVMETKSRAEQDAYFRDGLEWLEQKHGKANVIYAGIHRDEKTPHMYAYVVPIDERGKLNCRAFLGGSNALSQMQTNFAQVVGQQHGLERGIEGSKARHTSIKQYYSRAVQDFEPLPEVKTPIPKLRPEPEKPGLLAGSLAKETYKADHAAWEREAAIAELQRERRKAEVKARNVAAIETAKRHEAQAREAAALKVDVLKLKRSNSIQVKKVAASKERLAELAELTALVELLTPEEIIVLQARKRAQEAETTRQTELGRVSAEKGAKEALIASERERRVQGIHALLSRAGAEHTFGVKAVAAIREAGGDSSQVDWPAVEGATIGDAIGKHGQSAESVVEAINQYSPFRVNPASHQEISNWVMERAPQLKLIFDQSRTLTKNSPKIRF